MSARSPLTREACADRDQNDPLAAVRGTFDLPQGVIYLDGNSLGPLPGSTLKRLTEVIEREWGQGLIGSWNGADWIGAPVRVGERIGRLVGAAPDQVVVADSTSVNLFKVLAAALALRPERVDIVIEAEDFPTDAYIAQGVTAFRGRGQVRMAPPGQAVEAIDTATAVVLLSHVNYRTGALHDLAGLTAAIHARGGLVCWDLSHSVGVVPIDLDGAGADFAVGCGYKFLNGGPGAPAFVYVAQRHLDVVAQPLSGWLGHAEPFAFSSVYVPVDGIGRFACGTPPILSLTALERGIDLALRVDMDAVRAKSLALTDLLIELVNARCGAHPLTVITPRERERRGSQVSLCHEHAYEVCQALISRGVIGDFRAPDILRLGVAPLYLRYVDMWHAVATLAEVLDTREWDDPRFRVRMTVT